MIFWSQKNSHQIFRKLLIIFAVSLMNAHEPRHVSEQHRGGHRQIRHQPCGVGVYMYTYKFLY